MSPNAYHDWEDYGSLSFIMKAFDAGIVDRGQLSESVNSMSLNEYEKQRERLLPSSKPTKIEIVGEEGPENLVPGTQFFRKRTLEFEKTLGEYLNPAFDEVPDADEKRAGIDAFERARVQAEIKSIENEIETVRSEIRARTVSNQSFAPVEKIMYALVAMVLVVVAGAMFMLIVPTVSWTMVAWVGGILAAAFGIEIANVGYKKRKDAKTFEEWRLIGRWEPFTPKPEPGPAQEGWKLGRSQAKDDEELTREVETHDYTTPTPLETDDS